MNNLAKYIKDNNNPNFLNVVVSYETGNGAVIALGRETMSGQKRKASAIAAIRTLDNIANELEAKYNVEDIEITDLENGKALLFAVSDDFINVNFNN